MVGFVISKGAPGMAVGVIGLHGGTSHKGVIVEAKAMHLKRGRSQKERRVDVKEVLSL